MLSVESEDAIASVWRVKEGGFFWGKRGGEGWETFGVELLVHSGVCIFEPVLAFFGRAAEFAVLGGGYSSAWSVRRLARARRRGWRLMMVMSGRIEIRSRRSKSCV